MSGVLDGDELVARSPTMRAQQRLFKASSSAPTLRPYQRAAIDKLRALFVQGKKRVVLIAPTGAGKTVMFANVAAAAVSKGKRVVVLAHRKELVDQTVEKLAACGIDAGVVMADDHRRDDELPMQVCSIQTLYRRLKAHGRHRLPRADLVIYDEVHHSLSDSSQEVFGAYEGAFVIGATATPWRTDRLGLGDFFDDCVVAATMKELIAQGSLVDYEPFAYDCPDLHDVGTVAGEFNQRDLALACNTQILVGSIVREYLAHAAGRPGILFPVDIAHSKHLVAEFKSAGVLAEHLDCDTPAEQRAEMIQGLRHGTLSILSSVGVLTEGFDCLDSETEILTAAGWRGIGEVAEGDSVYALNRETEVLEVVPVRNYVERPVAAGERMVSIRSQHANIRTTEGHEFHIKYRDPGRRGALSKAFLTRSGANLVGRKSAYALPTAAEADFPGVPLTDDELRLIAWFMTDGGFQRTHVGISQSKSHHTGIRALLQRLGLDFTERLRTPGSGAFKNSKPVYEFKIPKGNQTGKQARRGWVQYERYLNKNVSFALQAMTREQFRVFWEELLKGDGAKQGNKAGWLWCDRQEQADAYTQMAVVRGFSASFSTQKTAAGRTMFVVSVRDRRWLTSSPEDPRAARVGFEAPAAGERVWCVRNDLSTVVTRRHGKVAILGNCPAAEVCILARPTKSLSLHLQMCGRVMRPSPGKDRALIHDHAGNVLRHGLPDDDRDYSLAATPPSVRSLHTCPLCNHVFASLKDGKCPGCGELIAMQAPPPAPPALGKGKKDFKDGKRLDRAAIEALREQLGKVGAKRLFSYEQLLKIATATRRDKAAEYLRLKKVQREKGFKPGFVSHQYREVFGRWPVFKDEDLAGIAPAGKPFIPLPARGSDAAL